LIYHEKEKRINSDTYYCRLTSPTMVVKKKDRNFCVGDAVKEQCRNHSLSTILRITPYTFLG
jgi:hypothetical protein